MHELIAHDWLDHDYIAQHTLGWEHCAKARLQWPPERAAEVCGIPVEQIRQLARDYGTTKPAAIRLNYGMQRVRGGGQCRARRGLPARAHRRVAAPRGRAAAVQLGPVSGGSRRAAPPRPAGRAHTAHHQHVHHWRRPAARGLAHVSAPRSRPWWSTTATRGRGARFGQGGAGLCREDLFTVVLEHFHTDTADYADYILPATTQLEHWDVHLAYGHTDVMLNRPAIAPVGQARSNAQIFRDLAARMGFDRPCFADSDETLCRQAFGNAGGLSRCSKARALPRWRARCAVCRRPLPHAFGPCEFFSAWLADAQGLDGLPDHVPNHELQGTDARYPLAMISPPARNFPNSSFVNVKSLRTIEGRPLLEIHPDDAAARGIADGSTGARVQRPGQLPCQCRSLHPRPPRRGERPGHLVAQAGLNGTNVNEGDQPGPDRPGAVHRRFTTVWWRCRRATRVQGRRLLRKSPPDIHHREIIDRYAR